MAADESGALSPMREITAGLFVSLDGIVADPQDRHFRFRHEDAKARLS
ncbi:hypothetical protein [Nocardia aurantiaca]|uniref:Uncharacterized protein n=1 Tax=Nocardia aurantiaca TaxID=2675850 RepID=A0A6I3KYM9_9NOCA|nr:hypothetical protein [Nocardia aurantiaca]MTE14058.1 hypothetical protein [Nocardia aurantiaca]